MQGPEGHSRRVVPSRTPEHWSRLYERVCSSAGHWDSSIRARAVSRHQRRHRNYRVPDTGHLSRSGVDMSGCLVWMSWSVMSGCLCEWIEGIAMQTDTRTGSSFLPGRVIFAAASRDSLVTAPRCDGHGRRCDYVTGSPNTGRGRDVGNHRVLMAGGSMDGGLDVGDVLWNIVCCSASAVQAFLHIFISYFLSRQLS